MDRLGHIVQQATLPAKVLRGLTPLHAISTALTVLGMYRLIKWHAFTQPHLVEEAIIDRFKTKDAFGKNPEMKSDQICIDQLTGNGEGNFSKLNTKSHLSSTVQHLIQPLLAAKDASQNQHSNFSDTDKQDIERDYRKAQANLKSYKETIYNAFNDQGKLRTAWGSIALLTLGCLGLCFSSYLAGRDFNTFIASYKGFSFWN